MYQKHQPHLMYTRGLVLLLIVYCVCCGDSGGEITYCLDLLYYVQQHQQQQNTQNCLKNNNKKKIQPLGHVKHVEINPFFSGSIFRYIEKRDTIHDFIVCLYYFVNYFYLLDRFKEIYRTIVSYKKKLLLIIQITSLMYQFQFLLKHSLIIFVKIVKILC